MRYVNKWCEADPQASPHTAIGVAARAQTLQTYGSACMGLTGAPQAANQRQRIEADIGTALRHRSVPSAGDY